LRNKKIIDKSFPFGGRWKKIVLDLKSIILH
jgi:hypothetical protein